MLTRVATGTLANIQEKWMHDSGKMPSHYVAFRLLFRVGCQYGINAFLLQGKRFNFIWMYVLLDTETTSVCLFYNIESCFVTIHR